MFLPPKILPIYLFSNPILNQPTEPVVELTGGVRHLIINMKHTLAHIGGVGLAANQVGSKLSICLVQNIVLINPQILNNNNITKTNYESCLSIPKIGVEVNRYEQIELRYLDEAMQEIHICTSHEFFARVIQHEICHLNGKTILEHLIPSKEQENYLFKLSKGYIKTRYLTIP